MTLLIKSCLIYACGIAWGFFVRSNIYLLGAGLAAAFCLLAKPLLKRCFFLLLIVFLGAWWTNWHLEVRENLLSPFYYKQVKAEGTVTALGPAEKNYAVIKLKKVNAVPLSARIRLYSEKKLPYRVGDYLVWQGKLTKPPVSYNPGMNQDFWLTSDIQGFSFLQQETACLRGQNWLSCISSLKEGIVKRLELYLPPEKTSLAAGMAFGDANKISREWEEKFRRAGLSHVLAASGQNIFFVLIFSNLLWNVFFLPERLKHALNCLAVVLYMAVAGFSLPVVRAGIMALFLIISRLIKRQVATLHLLFCSALIMLLVNPLNLFNLSFQLSFLAVLALLLLMPFWQAKLSFLPEKFNLALSSVLAVESCLLPLLLYYFQEIAVLSVLVNITAVPILEGALFLTLSFAVMGFGILGASLAGLIDLLLSLALWLIDLVAGWQYSYVSLASFSLFYLLAYYFLWGIWLWGAEKYRKKAAALTAFIVMLVFAAQIFWQLFLAPLQVTFFDVGQGDCILLQTPDGKNIVIDGGPADPVRTLRRQGVKSVDLLFITHFHEDHYSGALAVLSSMPVKEVCSSTEGTEDFEREIRARNISWHKVRAGDTFYLGDKAILQVLYPVGRAEEGNNSSLVLRLTYHQLKILFTGDLEAEGEEELLRRRENLASNILKVGHHGSSTSTSALFLQAVSPQIGIISVGKNNRFGHPAKEILDRLQGAGVRVLRTDDEGAVLVKTNGCRCTIKTMKEAGVR